MHKITLTRKGAAKGRVSRHPEQRRLRTSTGKWTQTSGYHIFYPNNHHTKLHFCERWYFIVAGELCKLAPVTGPEFPYRFSPVRRLVSVLSGKLVHSETAHLPQRSGQATKH